MEAKIQRIEKTQEIPGIKQMNTNSCVIML